MKQLLCLLTGLCIANTLSAQITLSSSAYTSAVAGTTDTLKRVQLSTLPVQTTGANQAWNFSGVVFDSTMYSQHSTVPSGAFSSMAQYADSVKDSIGYTYYFNTTPMRGIDTSGLLTYGAHINQQSIWLSAAALLGSSIDATDSFKLFTQDVIYTHANKNLAFPATYGSYWTDSFSTVMHGSVTVGAFSYINKPADFQVSYVITDTVVGWGTLYLKSSSGANSTLNVLQVKSMTTSYKSTIIDGAAISESQHDFTELPHLDFGSTAQYLYYTADVVTPVVRITFSDNYTTPSKAEVLSKDFPPAESVAETPLASNISIYPNPISDHNVYIDILNDNNSKEYSLVNILGQTLSSGHLSANHQHSSIQLPAQITPGIYYLTITEKGQKLTTRKITVE